MTTAQSFGGTLSDGYTSRRFITGYMGGSNTGFYNYLFGYQLMSGNLNLSTSGVTVGAFTVRGCVFSHVCGAPPMPPAAPVPG